jgi:hypothetical protein
MTKPSQMQQRVPIPNESPQKLEKCSLPIEMPILLNDSLAQRKENVGSENAWLAESKSYSQPGEKNR